MKKILIAGVNSYVGTHFEEWVKNFGTDCSVDSIDMRGEKWKEFDFSPYDVVFHVAGIAHVSTKKKLAPLYFSVNRDLAIATAIKAKNEGVKQFIFMSSMIIFGRDNNLFNHNPIDTSILKPINAYGQSKLEADLAIQKLNSESFKTVIIRSPVIYGPRSKGNFLKLEKLAKYSFVFPKINNMRSMIYISNLCSFIECIIKADLNGIFYPQNEEYISTAKVIRFIKKQDGKKYRESFVLAWLVKVFSLLFPFLRKVFGDKYYDQKNSKYNFEYRKINFEQSLIETLINNESTK